MLDKMSQSKQQSGYAPTWDAFKLLQSGIAGPSITNAAVLHALAVKQGALTNLHTTTSLLTVYSRNKNLVSSLALFGEALHRDVVFWNAMMSACTDNKCYQAAVDFFKKMVSEGHGYDSTTLLIALSASSNLKNLGHGKVVHGLSVKTGMLSETVLSNATIDMYAKCGELSSAERIFEEIECEDLISWNSIIAGCSYNSRPEKTLWYFAQMVSFGNRADGTTISCAVAACTCLQVFDVGRAVHGVAIKWGYVDNSPISVDNSLISFYSQSRDMYAGELVFKRMLVKNVVSWNAMIKGFFMNGETTRAFYLLHDMQFVESIRPDITTIVTVVPYCAELMLLCQGKAAHGFIVRREMMSELPVINSLINMYSKCSNVKKAELLFSTMPKKDSVSWNTMIFGYAQNGQSWEARKLFKKMMSCYSARTLATLLAVAPSCDSQESLQFGRSIHGWSIKSAFSNQIFASNSLMHMYVNCGVLQDAFALFGRISSKADVSSWNTIIAGCTHKCRFWEALEYFNLMRKTSRVRCNSVTLVSVVSACGNLGLSIQGKLSHGLALKTAACTNLQVQNSLVTMYGRLGDPRSAESAFNQCGNHNLCSWNCLISAVSKNEDARIALKLFCSLEFEPNEITVSTVLSACTQLGAVSYGKQIHGHVFRFGFYENPFISSALLDMYSHCGRLDTAERVFLSSPGKSVAAWNSLISAYGFHNFGSKSIETFQEMTRSGIRPTNGSFTSLLSACSHAGMIDEGWMYYDHMLSKFNVEPTIEHHVCMVDMLGRCGKINEAYDFIKNLQSKTGPGVWGALLSACGYHGDLEMGRKVAEIIFSLEPDNVSYYIALCNMYVAAGKWEEAVELRNIIQERQLKKEVGYSFIVGMR
ncbi:hypothetical protein OROMI_020260 [Orobanche minor]